MLEDARKRLADTEEEIALPDSSGSKSISNDPEKASAKDKEPKKGKPQVGVLSTHVDSPEPKVKLEVVLSMHGSTTLLGQLQRENESTQKVKGQTDVLSVLTV